jgi:hypothetical protein
LLCVFYINSISRQGLYLLCITCICECFYYLMLHSIHVYEKYASMSLLYIADYDLLIVILIVVCYSFSGSVQSCGGSKKHARQGAEPHTGAYRSLRRDS